MFHIYVNGQEIQTQSNTLITLLEELQFDISCVATAIDGNFVAKTLYANTSIQSGQKIEVLAPMQGG